MKSNPTTSHWLIPLLLSCVGAAACGDDSDSSSDDVEVSDDDTDDATDESDDTDDEGPTDDTDDEDPDDEDPTDDTDDTDDEDPTDDTDDEDPDDEAPTDDTDEDITDEADGGADDTDDAQPGDAGAPTDDSGTEPEPEPDTDALYALVTQVFGADTTDSYVVLTDTLDTSAPLSLDTALEIPGRAIAAGATDAGRLFIASDTSATVTRYDLEGSQLALGDSISFQGKGLAALGEYGGQFQFAAEHKAYYFDGTTGQVVVWDPEDMAVTGDIPLADFIVEGALLTFSASPVWVDTTLVTFAGWREGPAVPSLAGIVSIDTETDDATVVLDDRCGYVRDGVLANDGFVYVATEAYGAAVHRLNANNAAPSCLLRFDPVSNEFDEDFHVELADLFDGRSAGSLVVGPSGSAFLKVLDESAFAIAEDTHPRVLASAPAWSWAKLTTGDDPSAELLDAAPGNGSVIVLELGSRRFMALSVGRDSTNIVELTNDGPGEATTSIPGVVFSGVKLR